MTYTIIGRCARTGQLGVGIATYSLAVGGLCPAVEGNVGVLSSQAFVNPELKTLGLKLLRDGYSAAQALEILRQGDPSIEYRQIGIVDREGRSAAFTGNKARPWSGHQTGSGYAAFGNVLTGDRVVTEMTTAFERSADEPLAERLIIALEAGRDAGGQAGSAGHLPERSAAVAVYGLSAHAEIDLRSDVHTDAVGHLRSIYTEYLPYVAFHRTRWLEPQSAMPQEQFVSDLQRFASY